MSPWLLVWPALLLVGTAALPCPRDWTLSGRVCYFTNSSSQLSWAGADALCQEIGGQLAHVTDRYKHIDINELLFNNPQREWWISTRRTSGFSDDWNKEEAVDFYGEDKVLQRAVGTSMCVYTSTDDGLWYWSSCDALKSYVCEQPVSPVELQPLTMVRNLPTDTWMTTYAARAHDEMYGVRGEDMLDDEEKGVYSAAKATVTPLPPTTPTTPSDASDPSSPTSPAATIPPASLCHGERWKMLDDSCYQLFLDAANWTTAEAYCQAHDAHLASFQTQQLQQHWREDFNFHSGLVWFGLRKNSTGWFWPSGASLTYTTWRQGQPDDANGHEGCGALALHTGEWSDEDCAAYKPFVCRRDLDADASPSPGAVTSTTAATPTNCPADWMEHEGHCFFAQLADTPRGWHDAQRACRSLDSNLAKVDNYETKTFLLSKISGSTLPVWLGLSRVSTSEQMRWLDESRPSFTSWGDGGEDQESMKSCVRMSAENGNWDIVNCNSPQFYICEKPVRGIAPAPTPTAPPPRSKCPEGWQHYGKTKCTRVFEKAQTWQGARDSCRSYGTAGDLVSVGDPVDQAYLTGAVSDTVNSLWIGLTYVTGDSRFLTWSDESRFNFTNWAAGQPSLLCDACPRTCGVVTGGKTSHPAVWNDVECTQRYGYICQQTATADNSLTPRRQQCPAPHSDFMAVADGCFKLVLAGDAWHDALSYCRAHNSSLAYVRDVFDNAALLRLIYGRSKKDFWLGLSDTIVYGEMRWSAPWPPTLDFSDWDPQLHRMKSRNSCAVIHPETGHWNYQNCASVQPYVCMNAPSRSRAPTSSGCPSPAWFSSAGRCFTLRGQGNAGASWDDAARFCSDAGYQLAVVTTQDDQLAVRDTVSSLSTEKSAWIGLHRPQPGAGFRWEDGSKLGVTAWQRPQSSLSLDDCVMADKMSGGKWKAEPCSYYRPYICMVQRVVSPSSDTPSTAAASSSTTTGGSSTGGWGVFGVICLVMAVVAVVLFVARVASQRYLISWSTCLSRPTSRPQRHHSIENLSYSHHRDSTGDQEAVLGNGGTADHSELNRWGSQQELVAQSGS